MNFKLIILTSLFLFFIGCGGSSSDKIVKFLEQNSTNIAPKIENYETNSTVKISMYDTFTSESNISVISILANDINNDDLIYSLSGVDSDKFIIYNGELLLKKYSTYTLPLDYNFDNIYEVSVIVSDEKGGVDIVNFNIEIKEKYEIVTPIVAPTLEPMPEPTIEPIIKPEPTVEPIPIIEPIIKPEPTVEPIPIIEPIIKPTPMITIAPTATPEPIISMNLNEEYIVSKGDKVEILTDDSVINVLHTLDDDTKIITLISGSANLIKGDFAVIE